MGLLVTLGRYCWCKTINLNDRLTKKRGEEGRGKLILRGVLFADLFKLLIPGGPAVVGLLPEPGDHVYVLIRVDHDVVGLRGTNKARV